MKNYHLLIIAFLFLSQLGYSQIQTKIIGEWEVLAVESTKETRLNKQEERTLKLLQKASLEFNSDGSAKFKQILSGFHIPNGYWYYNKEKDAIFITEWDNKNVDLMRFWYDDLGEDGLKLYMDGTPFVLVVQRK